jgi:hypothetical protein
MQTKEFSNREHTIVVRTNSPETINQLTKDFEEVGNGTIKRVLQIHKPQLKSSYDRGRLLDAMKCLTQAGSKYVRIGFGSPLSSYISEEASRLISLKAETRDPDEQMQILIAPRGREA